MAQLPEQEQSGACNLGERFGSILEHQEQVVDTCTFRVCVQERVQHTWTHISLGLGTGVGSRYKLSDDFSEMHLFRRIQQTQEGEALGT